MLREAWDPAEVRFEAEEIPRDLLKHEATRKDPRVRAQIYRRAFEGGYSKDGEWAWLRYPPESGACRDPRTFWLTRMPGKSWAQWPHTCRYATPHCGPTQRIWSSTPTRQVHSQLGRRLAEWFKCCRR